MSDARGFEVVVPPDCQIGDAEARAIVASSRPAGELPLTDDIAVNVRTSTLVERGRVYVLDLDKAAEIAPPSAVARTFRLQFP